MVEHKARVLVVDDEENQRRGLSSLISAWGYEVRQAENGASDTALRSAAAREGTNDRKFCFMVNPLFERMH